MPAFSFLLEYPILLTSDTHFTDSPQDAYRFGLFPWIRQIIKEQGVRTVIFGGDLTDAKDEHPARLVNQVVEGCTSLGVPCIFNLGNHDYAQLEHPFFKFLNQINGFQFVTAPTVIGNWVLIPHSKQRPLPGLDLVRESTAFCLLHQTFAGARASNGQVMEGELYADHLPHARTCHYLSGDIHVPQTVGQVEYVGSPYHVHFGDRFAPSVMLIRSPRIKPVRYTWAGLHRFTTTIASVRELDDLHAQMGDQLKVKVKITRAELADWQSIKSGVQSWCDHKGVRLCGLELIPPPVRKQLKHHTSGLTRAASPASVLERYADYKKLTDAELELGLELIHEN